MTKLNLRVNLNGNTRDDLMAQTRRMAKARNDLSDALMASDLHHGRNYQTYPGGEAVAKRNEDLAREAAVWAALEVINAYINDAQLGVIAKAGE